MNKQKFYLFLQKQILLMMFLSLIPGLAYIVLGWINGVLIPALIWYALIIFVSIWGWKLYHNFKLDKMSTGELSAWYRKLTIYL